MGSFKIILLAFSAVVFSGNLFGQSSTKNSTGDEQAHQLMQRVIEHKHVWRSDIHTYQARISTRQHISSDSTIVSISERSSQLYWDQNKGYREVLSTKSDRAYSKDLERFEDMSGFPNFYDDDIEIGERIYIGVTHPDALDIYAFEIGGTAQINGQRVKEIHVKPKRKRAAVFKGTIYMLEEELAIVSVKLSPAKLPAVPTPVPFREFELLYEQNFFKHEQGGWFPENTIIAGKIRSGLVTLYFPHINYSYLSRATDYEVNSIIPSSVSNEAQVPVYAQTIYEKAENGSQNINNLPQTDDEERAFTTLGDTPQLKELFIPKGFSYQFIDKVDNSDDDGDGLLIGGYTSSDRPSFLQAFRQGFVFDSRFNRVDLLYAGGKYVVSTANRRLQLKGFGGYSFGYDESSFGGSITWKPTKDVERFEVGFDYYEQTDTRYQTDLYSLQISSIRPLIGFEDFFDYFRKEGFTIRSSYALKDRFLTLSGKFVSEEHRSLGFSSNYDLFGSTFNQRPNPFIDDGDLRALTFGIDTFDGYNYSFGVYGSRGFNISAEFSGDALASDFMYSKYHLNAYYTFKTFYRDRLFPHTFHMRLIAGTSAGSLPFQRFGILDGGKGSIAPYGGFRARRQVPFEGEHYIGLNVEHNFRTSPFEAMGFDFLVNQGIGFILFGGVGQTWISDSAQRRFLVVNDFNPEARLLFTENVHSELGFSFNGILNIVRVDIAMRLEDQTPFIGISVGRWF